MPKKSNDLPSKMFYLRLDAYDEAILEGLCKKLRVDRTSILRIGLQQMADRYGVQADFELVRLLACLLPAADKDPELKPVADLTRRIIRSRLSAMAEVERKFPKDIAKLLIKRRASSKRRLV